MSLNAIISETSNIRNFMNNLSFGLHFSKPVFRHIEEFIDGAIQVGYRGKVTDIVNLSYAACHRTTYGKFLKNGVWEQEYIWRAIRKLSINTIYKTANQTNHPLFVIYDDTTSEKTKPSSKAKNPIEEADFHYSHLDNKTVWGHQMMAALLNCQKQSVPYLIERYNKNAESKIDKVCRIIDSLPAVTGAAYGLCDSWFTSKKVIEAHLKKGYHLIGGLKTNRIIYPQGIRIQIKDFEQYIQKSDVRLVTVGNSSYWTYRYDGALTGIDNAVVILCWPKDAFKKSNCLRAFLCTDTELSTQTVLEYYSHRWPVEIFFRQNKGNFGLNKYQVRSVKAIDRILALIALTYLYCIRANGTYQCLGLGLRKARKSTKREKIAMIYKAAVSGIPIEDVFIKFNVV